MREEFLYWYPVDMRISAKELVPNHLTFYIFQHVAIFEPRHWPRGIGVNGMVKIEGEKMSKSKGNFIPLKRAIEVYGADATRMTLLLAAEDLDDPDWRDKNAREAMRMLETILKICEQAASMNVVEDGEADAWLLSALQRRIEKITSAMEMLKTRTAASEAIYGLYNDWKWYLRRNGGRIGRAARIFIETWIRLLAPFIPFTAEEAWSILGKSGFVSLERWPEPDKRLINEVVELREEILTRLMEDVRSIIEVYGRNPKRVVIYLAAPSKIRILERALEILDARPHNPVGELIRWMVSERIIEAKKAPNVARLIFDLISAYSSGYAREAILEVARGEKAFYERAREFLERELGASVEIYEEGAEGIYDPIGKASSALPLRPGLYIE
jgi:leucyl-tRNA synthetase